MKKMLLFLALFAIACAAPVPPSDAQASHSQESDPDIRGEVTQVMASKFRIEDTPTEQRGNKAVVTWNDETVVRDRDGKTVDASSIRVGQTVSVWYTGPVMKSYPLQATARMIVVE